MNESTVIEKFYRIFGEVVLLPVPLGTKKPILKGWQKLTFAASRSPAHRAKLLATVARGGNIGILLGKASGGLMAIDLDGDDFADSFIKLNPELANTTRTRGKKGCQLWVRMKPGTNYPNGQGYYSIQTWGGEKYGEWRCAGDGKGAQSVVFCKHPEGPLYEIQIEAPPLEIDFQTIHWPADVKLPWVEQEKSKKSREELAADAVAKSIDAYYDQPRKEYVLRDGNTIYQSLREGQFKRVLRFRGLNAEFIRGRSYSQLDVVIRSLQQNRYVNYVGPLAGRDCGYYLEPKSPFSSRHRRRLSSQSEGNGQRSAHCLTIFFGVRMSHGAMNKRTLSMAGFLSPTKRCEPVNFSRDKRLPWPAPSKLERA